MPSSTSVCPFACRPACRHSRPPGCWRRPTPRALRRRQTRQSRANANRRAKRTRRRRRTRRRTRRRRRAVAMGCECQRRVQGGAGCCRRVRAWRWSTSRLVRGQRGSVDSRESGRIASAIVSFHRQHCSCSTSVFYVCAAAAAAAATTTTSHIPARLFTRKRSAVSSGDRERVVSTCWPFTAAMRSPIRKPAFSAAPLTPR